MSGSVTNNGLIFNTNNTVFDTAGSITKHSVVGLVVRGTSGSVFDYSLYSAGGTALITNPTNTNNINFNSGQVWFNGGFVGVGMNNPNSSLSVKTDTNAQGINIWGRSDDFAVLRFQNSTGTFSNATIYATNTYLALETSGSERIRITSAGTLQVKPNTIGTVDTADRSIIIGSRPNSSTIASLGFDTGGTYRGNIDFSGANGNFEYWAYSGTSFVNRFTITDTGVVKKPHQPAFKAGRSTNYSAGANSTIIFNDTSGIHFNIGGHYNASTGIFTAPADGVYIFSAVVIYQSIPGGTDMSDAFYIYKNSTLSAYSFRRAEYEAGYTGNGGYYVDHANTILNLVTGDTVSIRNNRAFEIHGNTAYSYFYGYMLG
jgi:hypothetical protein